ncbi:MAG: 30S ribosomal protein S6 [Oscillospiraceae bacterium]|nr:30S ribosomal protein S6 [Oscillospiraceae bacterium]
MAKIMAKYEVTFIIDCSLGDDVAAMVEKFKTLVSDNATIIGEVEEWGKRKLAYPIDDLTEGYYVFITFESKPDFPAELDRVFKITDGIMRSLIICLDNV